MNHNESARDILISYTNSMLGKIIFSKLQPKLLSANQMTLLHDNQHLATFYLVGRRLRKVDGCGPQRNP